VHHSEMGGSCPLFTLDDQPFERALFTSEYPKYRG
jgi:hypothetical protein